MIPYALYPLTNQRSFVDKTNFAVTISNAAYRVVTAIGEIAAWVVWRNKSNKTIQELSRLSDHVLKDIGIERHEIRALADGLIDSPTDRPSDTVARFTPRTRIPVADNDNERRFSAMI